MSTLIGDGMFVVDGEVFLEMATIRSGFMSIRLAAYGSEETGCPHFHFYKNLKPKGEIPESVRQGGGCLCIESANYFVYGEHTERLTSEEIKGLIKFLKEPNGTLKKISNWEYILGLWNDNNPMMKQVPMDTVIPDYKSDMDIIQDRKSK